jgi:hypothetical protein
MQLSVLFSHFEAFNAVEHGTTFSLTINNAECCVVERAENLIAKQRTFTKRSTKMRAFIGNTVVFAIDFSD